ncbi:MAG: type II toxin-antitoxin system Phd/YefM family antitoxin [Planctomycetales bacterium]
MTRTYEIADAQDHLLELVNLVSEGHEVIISRDAKPLVRLVAILEYDDSPSKSPRTPGLSRGAIKWISPDFDDPLPDEFWLGTNENPA